MSQIHRDWLGRRHLRISFDITTTTLWLITTVLSLSSTPTEVLSDHINDTYHHRIPMSLISLRPSIGICKNRHGLASKHAPDRQPWLKVSPNKSQIPSTLCILMLLTSGDIEPNPGPIRHPCGICERLVAANHRAICCASCDTWIHIKCANMAPKEYQKHQNSSCTWICFRCGMPTFSDSFFENSTISNLSNSCSALSDSVSSDDSPNTSTEQGKKANKRDIN